MSSCKLPATPSLISITCDALAEVLDLFRRRNANLPPSASPKLLLRVKTLLEALHRLEETVNHLANTQVEVDAQQRMQMNTTLNSCGTMAKILQLRIECNSLQDSLEMDREISSLINAVNGSFEMLFERPTESCAIPGCQENITITRIDPTREDNVHPPERWLDPGNLQAVVEGLHEENNRLKAQIADLQSTDMSKILHINQLHLAVKTLNKLHPPRPQSSSWEHLSDELPHMIALVEETNDTLSHLDSSPSTSSRPAPMRSRHSHTRSTPCTSVTQLVARSNSMSQSTVRRPPSPIESTVSSFRSETPTIQRPKPRSKRNSGLFKFVQV